jgi:class 3 adenylate cyclase/CheY-like chemotaxis protein
MSKAATATGRVLLVDDSEIVLEAVARALREQGWTVQQAVGGQAGLDALDGGRADVIVCDLHMPEVDGLAVLSHVLAHQPRTPVVMLSGDDDLTAVLKAVRHGAFDYVVKSGEDMRPIGEAVRRAFEHVQLRLQNERLADDLASARERLADQLRELKRQHELLEHEQRRSERLILNILPRPIAERLKGGDDRGLVADRFEGVTVLFADVVGFTPLSAGLTPDALVTLLNDLVSRFDHLATGLGIEKIKTLGDAYMAAAGLPTPCEDHAEVAALMALRMLEAIAAFNLARGTSLRMRIGLHSGPVVAGVIGTSKFIYDLWGDTVNVAARMESHGVPGAIQVSRATADLLQARFVCEPRGIVEVKGKGPMEVFLLTGLA